MTCIFKKFIDLCDQTTGNKERLQGPRDFGATRELVDDSPNILQNVITLTMFSVKTATIRLTLVEIHAATLELSTNSDV